MKITRPAVYLIPEPKTSEEIQTNRDAMVESTKKPRFLEVSNEEYLLIMRALESHAQQSKLSANAVSSLEDELDENPAQVETDRKISIALRTEHKAATILWRLMRDA